MQVAQRILLVVAAVFAAVTVCFAVNQGRVEKRSKQWEEIRVEMFLQQIIKKQELTISDYIVFLKEVRYFDDTPEVGIEIYQKENDLTGTGYYYLLSQEEIEGKLEQENGMELGEGNIIQIVIQHKNKRNRYSRVVPGKE